MNLFLQESIPEHDHCKFEINKVKAFSVAENRRIRKRAANDWILEDP